MKVLRFCLVAILSIGCKDRLDHSRLIHAKTQMLAIDGNHTYIFATSFVPTRASQEEIAKRAREFKFQGSSNELLLTGKVRIIVEKSKEQTFLKRQTPESATVDQKVSHHKTTVLVLDDQGQIIGSEPLWKDSSDQGATSDITGNAITPAQGVEIAEVEIFMGETLIRLAPNQLRAFGQYMTTGSMPNYRIKTPFGAIFVCHSFTCQVAGTTEPEWIDELIKKRDLFVEQFETKDLKPGDTVLMLHNQDPHKYLSDLTHSAIFLGEIEGIPLFISKIDLYGVMITDMDALKEIYPTSSSVLRLVKADHELSFVESGLIRDLLIGLRDGPRETLERLYPDKTVGGQLNAITSQQFVRRPATNKIPAFLESVRDGNSEIFKQTIDEVPKEYLTYALYLAGKFQPNMMKKIVLKLGEKGISKEELGKAVKILESLIDKVKLKQLEEIKLLIQTLP